MSELNPHAVALVRLAVERVASAPEDEQRYLELNFSVDRAVERNVRYRELIGVFESGAAGASDGVAWAWWLAAGLSANLRGDSIAAVRSLEQGAELLERAGRTHTAVGSFLYAELSRARYHRADHSRGIEEATRALQLARGANSLLAEAYARHYLGLISLRQRDLDFARRHITAARDLFERMHQRHGRARVLDSLAILEMEQGRYDPALRLLHESLAVKRDLRDLRGQALTCGNLARLHTALGDYEQALFYLDFERDLIARVGDERNANQLRVQLGELHLRHGNLALAREELLAAETLARGRGDERLEAYACFSLAEVERRLGDPDGSLQAILRACNWFDRSDDGVMRDRASLRRALLQGEMIQSPEVQGPLGRLRQAHAAASTAAALFEAATFYHEQGQVQEVAALYAEALDWAEPVQANQLAAVMRSRAQSTEGRAWVDAMMQVKLQKDRLENAYAELQHAESRREALIQMIVHDLKNPLTAITPWLQTIQLGGLTQEETEEYLQTAVDECHYLLRMIEDLNDYGKMQYGGNLELAREPLDLPNLIADVARRLQARAREMGMTIRVEQPAGESCPPLTGDPDKLRRVLENLVANAVKYGRPPEDSDRPPEVRIRWDVEPPALDGGEGSVRVSVADFGPGIPLAEAERVFEPYYQAEAGRRRKAGVGLGLAFCRLVVEAHGGAIWTESNPAGGSVFTLRLPRKQESA